MTDSVSDMTPFVPSRDLSPNERALLERLLDAGPIGEDALREQLKTARVTAQSHGDSRSVRLDVAPNVPPAEGSPRVPVEGTAADDDGVPIAALLHVVAGLMTELEIYRVDGEPIKAGEIRSLFNVVVNPPEPG